MGGIGLGILYLVFFASIKDRESFYAWVSGGFYKRDNDPSKKPGAGSNAGEDAVVAQADGHRSILNTRSNRDAIAMAESSFLTLPQHTLDPRYQLPEPVELPRSLAKYLRT